MKVKWMAVGLIAILTACGGNTEENQQASAQWTQQEAPPEAPVEQSAPTTEPEKSTEPAAAAEETESSQPESKSEIKSETKPETKTTVNKDGSVTTEITDADGTVTTMTTSQKVTTHSGNTKVESKVNVPSGGTGDVKVDATINTDATVNVDSTINVDPTISVESGKGDNTTEKVRDYADYSPRQLVQVVKQGALNVDSSMRVGEVFDGFFSNPKWRYFKSELNEDVVEFTGDANYGDEFGHTTVQFLLYDDFNFELFGIWVGLEGDSLDDEYSMSDEEISQTIRKIYESAN
ncbi:hypothetical protein B9G55_03910 [Saccharibacillus sp. O16]|nr:hypothetical protein B9G55_03910 [Saccharibacillus sp. O16]